MRIGYWDLETTALRADFGQLLCGVIGEHNSTNPLEPELSTYVLRDFKSPRGRCDDSQLAIDIKEHLEQFDLVIGYNSIKFDKNFLNTRLAFHGYGAVNIKRHKDLLYVMRYKFCLSSNSLKNACKFLFGNSQKTEMSMVRWREAHAGVRDAYDEVIYHCKQDVVELARMWDRVKDEAGVLK